MSIEIVEVAPDDPAYAAIVQESEHALFYHSPKYAQFLRRLMPDCESIVFLAVENGTPVAALPAMARPGAFGRVVNSLPFFGSHGGVVATPSATEAARPALIEAFHARNVREGVSWATVVTNPFLYDVAGLSLHPPHHLDERIGQFTPLPPHADIGDALEAVLAQCHQKTRNMIRKGMKSGYRLSHDGSPAAMEQLAGIHRDNMNAIGGLAKGPEVFEAIASTFAYDEDYRLYRADTEDEECASMLLVFYFKNFVEYFTPVTVEQHRSNQPLSALIATAMADAIVERGSKWWNWGGTWLSQDGVYHFKSRWGTQDRPYRYLIWSYPAAPAPATLDRTKLASEYPYFYTLPYRLLDAPVAGGLPSSGI